MPETGFALYADPDNSICIRGDEVKPVPGYVVGEVTNPFTLKPR